MLVATSFSAMPPNDNKRDRNKNPVAMDRAAPMAIARAVHTVAVLQGAMVPHQVDTAPTKTVN